MDPKKTGGAATVKKLDLVSDPSLWNETASAFLDGAEQLYCPLCKQNGVVATAACASDRVGFLLLSCPSCGKSAHFSRVVFPKPLKMPSLLQ